MWKGWNIIEETQQTARVNSKCKRPPFDDTDSSYKEAAKEMKQTFKEVGEKLNETIYNIGRQENKEACNMIDKLSKIYNACQISMSKRELRRLTCLAKINFMSGHFLR